MVDAFISVGSGYASMQQFGMELGMCVLSFRAWKLHLKKIEDQTAIFKDKVLWEARAAVRKVHGVSETAIMDLAASYDGTWQRRGFVSLNGAAFVVDILTGLVVDFKVLSKFCHPCAFKASELGDGTPEFLQWQEAHRALGECQVNHSGPSGQIEVAAAEIMWRRSMAVKMRYRTILSDGDSKTYSHLCSLTVYGRKVQIKKEECINQVAKRMSTGLTNLVQEWKAQNVTLGGKGDHTLKASNIERLTSLYKKAIVDHIPKVKGMQNAVMATLHHCNSTDKKPQHSKCPKGKESWCFFNRAKANRKKPDKSHTAMQLQLSDDLVEKLTPLYERLPQKSLMERCTRGATQNANESLHDKLWKLCPKDVFVSRARLEEAAARAVSQFNMGCLNSLGLRKELKGEELTEVAKSVAQGRDNKRKKQSSQQKRRTHKRFQTKQKGKTKQRKKQKNDDSYVPGGF